MIGLFGCSVNGSFVLVGGVQVPLYYVSDGQINAELPYELQPNRPQAVIVANNGAYSLPDQILFTAVNPGVATSSGILIAQHSDFRLVDSTNPAKPGEVLIMYLVGMGATNPPITTGEVAQGPLKPAAVQPTVTVGGLPATGAIGFDHPDVALFDCVVSNYFAIFKTGDHSCSKLLAPFVESCYL